MVGVILVQIKGVIFSMDREDCFSKECSVVIPISLLNPFPGKASAKLHGGLAASDHAFSLQPNAFLLDTMPSLGVVTSYLRRML